MSSRRAPFSPPTTSNRWLAVSQTVLAPNRAAGPPSNVHFPPVAGGVACKGGAARRAGRRRPAGPRRATRQAKEPSAPASPGTRLLGAHEPPSLSVQVDCALVGLGVQQIAELLHE